MSAKRPKTGGRNRRKCRVRTAFLPQLREKKEKIRPKRKKHCQKQAKGDMIDKNSKRKRVGFAIAIYPREGTETHPCHPMNSCTDCNLSPRGDGNRFQGLFGFRLWIAIYPREGTETHDIVMQKSHNIYNCNLSPRGDGNFAHFTHDFNPFSIAIYPREGTETLP